MNNYTSTDCRKISQRHLDSRLFCMKVPQLLVMLGLLVILLKISLYLPFTNQLKCKKNSTFQLTCWLLQLTPLGFHSNNRHRVGLNLFHHHLILHSPLLGRPISQIQMTEVRAAPLFANPFIPGPHAFHRVTSRVFPYLGSGHCMGLNLTHLST